MISPLPTNKEIASLREEFYKFCDDNGFNPARNECVDWWLDKLHLLRENDRKAVGEDLKAIMNRCKTERGLGVALANYLKTLLSSNHKER